MCDLCLIWWCGVTYDTNLKVSTRSIINTQTNSDIDLNTERAGPHKGHYRDLHSSLAEYQLLSYFCHTKENLPMVRYLTLGGANRTECGQTPSDEKCVLHVNVGIKSVSIHTVSLHISKE